MTDQAQETMDNILDRQKIVKVQEFRKSGNQWMAVNVRGAYINGDFEQWQRTNKKIKVIGTSIVAKEIQNYTPPTPPQKMYDEIMYVSYEEYEEIAR